MPRSSHQDPRYAALRAILERHPTWRLSIRAPGESEWHPLAHDRDEIPAAVELSLSARREPRTDLSSLTHLRADEIQGLDLGWTRIGDADLTHILHLTELHELDIGWTKVTDTGVRRLTPLQRLKVLKMGDIEISDAAIPALSAMRHLQRLVLRGTRVTDDCLPHLRSLNALRHLDVQRTAVTEQALMRWQTQRGDCETLR